MYPRLLERAEAAAKANTEHDTPATRAALIGAVALVRESSRARQSAGLTNREETTMPTPIDTAREAQRRIQALATQVQTAINGLDSTVTRNRTQAAEDRALGRPQVSERERYDRTEQSKRTLSATVRNAGDRLTTLQGELTRALAEAGVDSGAVASEWPVPRSGLSSRPGCRRQPSSRTPRPGTTWTRCGPSARRSGVPDGHRRDQRVRPGAGRQGRERVEFAADRVLARIGNARRTGGRQAAAGIGGHGRVRPAPGREGRRDRRAG